MLSKIKELIDKGKDAHNSASSYSFEEKVVGTWVNGKPVYQRTINLNNLSIPGSGSQATFNYNFSSLNIDLIISSNILIKGASSYSGAITSMGRAWGLIQLSKNNILIGQNQTGGNGYFIATHCIIQYTKTTD